VSGRLTLAVIACLASAAFAAPALGRAHRPLPRALDSPGDFVVRPAFMAFPLGRRSDASDYFFGPGLSARAAARGKIVRIRWRRWGARAEALGSFLGARCAERQGRRYDCAVHSYMSGRTAIELWRVRGGRYTRMRFRLLAARPYLFTEPYELREVSGVGGPTHSMALRWCAMPERASCLAP
jgi:hypothetical protein